MLCRWHLRHLALTVEQPAVRLGRVNIPVANKTMGRNGGPPRSVMDFATSEQGRIRAFLQSAFGILQKDVAVSDVQAICMVVEHPPKKNTKKKSPRQFVGWRCWKSCGGTFGATYRRLVLQLLSAWVNRGTTINKVPQNEFDRLAMFNQCPGYLAPNDLVPTTYARFCWAVWRVTGIAHHVIQWQHQVLQKKDGQLLWIDFTEAKVRSEATGMSFINIREKKHQRQLTNTYKKRQRRGFILDLDRI